jgi:hypothetical protein
LNGTIPAFTNMSVGSSLGTSGELGRISWPWRSKNSRKPAGPGGARLRPRWPVRHARIGKAGSGPGELSQAAGPVFVGPGDTLSVPGRHAAARQPLHRHGRGRWAAIPLPMSEGIAVKWMEGPDQEAGPAGHDHGDAGPAGCAAEEPPAAAQARRERSRIRSWSCPSASPSTSPAGARPSITVFESEPTWTVGSDGRFYFGNSSVYRLSSSSRRRAGSCVS